MTGLADCNNFFVSCERTENPELEGKAVVVMSNNDGCIVARSNEAKILGIKMGQPVFEIRNLIREGHVVALSGRHLLYREISLKVHELFRRYVPSTIDYSVDEAFLDVSGIPDNMLYPIGEEMCRACWNELHIPITIGFAKTKTLSKLVTEQCKKDSQKVGLLPDQKSTYNLLRRVPISDLWGIGRHLSKRLYQYGVFTVADFADRDRSWVRNKLGINGERSWLEIHGIDCIDLSHIERNLQDSISETRTFPYDIRDYDYIKTRIAIYGADCARKLRAMNGMCRSVTIFLDTNRFRTKYGTSRTVSTIKLPQPSDLTSEIVSVAANGLDRIFNKDTYYKRAGVILTEITPAQSDMRSLFDFNETSPASEHRLMKVIDRMNGKVGTPLLKLASQLTIGHPGHNDGYSSSFQAPSTEK